jgi:hypothetical protein
VKTQVASGAVRTPQPLASSLRDVFPHPAALSPHAHRMMQA